MFSLRLVKFPRHPLYTEEPSEVYELYIAPRRHPRRQVPRAVDDRRRTHASGEIRQTNGTLNKMTAIAKHRRRRAISFVGRRSRRGLIVCQIACRARFRERFPFSCLRCLIRCFPSSKSPLRTIRCNSHFSKAIKGTPLMHNKCNVSKEFLLKKNEYPVISLISCRV